MEEDMSTIGTFCTDIIYDNDDFMELYKAIRKEAKKNGSWVVRKIPGINAIAGKTRGSYYGYSSVAMHSIAQDVGKKLKNPVIVMTIEENRCRAIEINNKDEYGYRDIVDTDEDKEE
jgi:hypothetical protein